MKNLKKALVLVLAFAMVFGMFTINASAASFNDDEDIVNKEAVSTMSQLGIINGYEDGTFLPTQVVTRAEMCKMICVALNGGTAPILDSSTVVFSDTKGHWANAYISYCASKGIVSGDSGKGGAFRPDAAVTGLEAAKMMLVAIGYNAAITGLTGADWANNVSMAANDRSLFTNLGTLNVAAGLSRDNAAQMIYNGINAEMVTYSNILSTDANGQLTSTPKMTTLTNQTILTEKFGVSVLEGVVLASEFATVTADNAVNLAGETTILAKTNDGTILGGGAGITYILKTTTPADMVGMNVKVYVKDTSLNANTYNTVFGTPVVAGNRVKTFTSDNYSTSRINDFIDALKAAGINGYTANGASTGVKVVTNGGYIVDDTSHFGGGAGSATMDETSANALLARGKEVTFIDNTNDGNVDYVKVTEKYVGKVTVLNAAGNSGKGAITITTLTSVGTPGTALTNKTFDVVYGEENLAVDDYVLFTLLNGKYYVEKANKVTATVSATKPNTQTPFDGTVTAGGVTYKASELTNDVDGASNDLVDAVELGKDSDFYLDNYGYVVFVKSVVTSKYLVVTAVGNVDPLTGISVKVVKEDATSEVVKVASVTPTTGAAGKKTAAADIAALFDTNGATPGGTSGGTATPDDHIYSYTVKSNGDYELTALTTSMATTSIKTNDPTLGGSGLTANAKTVFVVKTGATTYSAFTGIAAAPTVSTGVTAYTYCKSTTPTTAAVVFVTAGGVSITGTSGVFICSTDYTKVLDGTTPVYQYPAVIDGVATTITATGTGVFPTIGYYGNGISKDSKGFYTAATKTAYVVPVSAVGNGIINGFTYDDATKVFEISATGAVTESAIGNIYDGNNGTDKSAAVIVSKGSSAPTVAKYIFVKGKSLAAPTQVDLVAGTGGSLAVPGTTLDLLSGTGTVSGWAANTDELNITVAAPAGATATITVNGDTVTSGTDFAVAATGDYTVVVTISQAGFTDTEYVYTYTVA